MKRATAKHLGLIVFFTAVIACEAQAQLPHNYVVKGILDFISNKLKKTDLQLIVEVTVIKKGNEKRAADFIALKPGSDLSFGPQEIERQLSDSVIVLALTNLDEQLYCQPCEKSVNLFSVKDGTISSPMQRVMVLVRDKNRNDMMLAAQALIKQDNIYSALKVYEQLDLASLDVTDKQKYVTKMQLADAYRQNRDYEKQTATYTDINANININGLSQVFQKRYWAESYDNLLLLQGVDTLTTGKQKIDFNADFGSMILSNPQQLERWKNFISSYKNSAFGKAKLANINADTFNTPEAITGQKRIIAASLDRKEVEFK
jgi:hypothetical protein